MTMLSPLQPPPLVGRGRELALLRAHFDAALAGRGGLVLIGGEAGIGKTALAEAVCREAMERGALVLIGRCYDLTETPPYGPWVEAFGTHRRDDGMPPLPDAFATRGTVGVVASQAALLHQVRDFLAALAEWQPVALLLDDLHWADAGSLDLLRFVARAATALPLLVIVTYRSDELTRRHALYSLLPALAREGNAARIEVRRLDDDAVRALIASRYPLGDGDTERLVAFIQSRTEGNALFASEVLRSLIETDTLRSSGDRWALGDLQRVALPPLLRQVIDGRIARLDAETQRLLPIAAAVGQEAPLAVLGALAAMDEEAVLASVEAAAGANVIAETADGLGVRFAHALIREAVYEGISPARRRLLHRRIGDLLAEQPQPDPDAVAMHFQQASDDRAVAWLVKAGERAQDAYAWATAAQRFETAFALVPEERPSERGWLLLRIVQLRRHAGDHRSLAYLEDAAALAEQAGDRTLAAWARFARGFLLSVVGKGPVAMQETEAGAAALVALSAEERARYPGGRPWMPALPHEVPFGPVIASAATFGWLSRAESLANRWMAPYFSEKDGVEAAWRDGWRGMGIVHAARGRPAEARMAFERAARGARRLGHHFYVGSALHTLLVDVALPYETEDRAARGQLAREAVAALALGAEVVSDVTWAAVPEYFVSGLWEDEAFLGERMQNRSVTGRAQGYVGEWHRARGNPDAAWGCVTWMLPDGIGTEPGDAPLTGTTYGQLAVALALDAGDRETAAEWLTWYDRWMSFSAAVLGLSEGQALWARYHRQMGDAESARAHAESALAHATEPRQPLALIATHRLLGELDTDDARYDEAARHLDASLALATACAAPYERALTLLATAELRAATGEKDAAAALLTEVRAICEPLGAKPTLARAAALATRLAAPATVVPSYPAGLSAREVEVLRLVAQGLTNPQVAERLFLSPRTVDQHLRSVYNKLGVSSRAAATHFAVTHGLA